VVLRNPVELKFDSKTISNAVAVSDPDHRGYVEFEKNPQILRDIFV
jgi:hypothetical protein